MEIRHSNVRIPDSQLVTNQYCIFFLIGWYGFIFLFLCCVTSAFTGVLLSRSWLVLMRWYPDEYLDEINRHPYPSIGYVAFGDAGR